MSTLQMALIGIVVILLVAWLWLRQRSTGRPAAKQRKKSDRIDTVIGWPPQPTRVLSTTERATLGTLIRALPEFIVLAQVPLSRFISVPKRNSYADWLRRVGYQCVDFLICDMQAQVVAVIELQPLQVGEQSRKRHERIARTLKAAAIPLHVWRETALPSVEAAREVLMARMVKPAAPTPASASTQPAVPVPASTPAAVGNPFDDTNRDSSHDETIELLEPPPSTWFDDLDSDRTPLSKG